MNNNRPTAAKIIITSIAVLTATAVCFALPLRPTRSATEKRKLAAFPSFSIEALADGSYFSDISLWFSDTVPFRDTLTELNGAIRHFLGTSGAQSGFNEGDKGDAIPEPVKKEEPVSAPSATKKAETTAAEEQTEATTVQTAEAAGEVNDFQTINGLLISGNAAFEYYNFMQEATDNYVDCVNREAASLRGFSTVYDIPVPTGMAIALDESVKKKVSSADQEAAMKYILGSLSDDVKGVYIYDTLMAHRNEYLYFRTDHHWTALGAYYAYTEFCAAKGIDPLPLSKFTKKTFDGLLGSFYTESGGDPALGATPDYVDTYYPPCRLRMMLTDTDGVVSEQPLLYDMTNADPRNKYCTFICGDYPLSVIENFDNEQGESCIVVKESFGNCFVPFLIYHYKYVYVVDYRYYDGTIYDLARQKNVSDVIFINNMSMTRAQVLVDRMVLRLGGE